MYADLGYNVNPFRIDYPFSAQQSSLAYKNNFSPFLGLGFAYKWFHLRVGFPVIGNLRPADNFLFFNFIKLNKFFSSYLT